MIRSIAPPHSQARSIRVQQCDAFFDEHRRRGLGIHKSLMSCASVLARLASAMFSHLFKLNLCVAMAHSPPKLARTLPA